MANQNIRLSTLFRNPVLRAAFARAEKDSGNSFAVPSRAPKRPVLSGSAARMFEVA